jgi:glyoxylase-like metal-dependent hydrolase (beta-lactamase superfamily II)
MNTLAEGLSFVDLHFQGMASVIATVILSGKGGVALIDPGPSSTLPTLRAELGRAGIAVGDITTLLLTHIHLDHAGSCGTLVHENPRIGVLVHEKGAPHLTDPARLLASARQLYGHAMDALWGEVRPVPAGAVTALAGGERITAGGRQLDVLPTPGHASHHVSYFSRDTGIAFVGDTAGVRLMPGGYVMPPTPPPDIDLDAWKESLVRIDRWRPDTVFVTHFGPFTPVAPHVEELREHLDHMAGLVRASLDREGSDTEREAWFIAEVRRELARAMSAHDVRAYEIACRFDLSWRGLARYWRKRQPAP